MEWYVNGPLGVEQGFTIADAPHDLDEARPAPLVLRVEVAGDLTPRLRPDGESVALMDAVGRPALRYSDLFAQDAAGKRLDARMVVEGQRIELTVADEDATYPIEIDPLVWSQAAILTASDPEDSAYFGYAVAIDGDYAAVGAPRDDGAGVDFGAVYVFERNYPDVEAWGQRKKIVTTSGLDYQTFGWAVALSGNTLLVGAPAFDFFGDQTQPGTVYVYERNYPNVDEWGRRATIVPSTSVTGADFGTSVSVSGDTAIVGAPREGAGGYQRGAAYVFDRGFGGAEAWGERAKLVAGDPHDSDYFGGSVDIDGDTAMVGARLVDGVGTNSGAAYLFERNFGGTNAWDQRAKLTASDAQAHAAFGAAVAVAGDIGVVGATGEDAGAVVGAGAAYVFERDFGGTNQWGARKKLVASDPQAGAHFGEAVAASGDSILVGAWSANAPATASGAAYAFSRNLDGPNEWGEQTKLTASNGASSDWFGTTVSVSADWALVGAIGADASGSDCGTAYLVRQGLTDGEPCTSPAQCVSGFCADDVCCDTVCAGGVEDCMACSEAQGGAADGVCGPIDNGSTCNDGQYCTASDSCTDGACVGTGDPCAAEVGDADSNCSESCDEDTDTCTAEDPDHSACDDGVYCNGDETCMSGSCGSSTGDPCTGPDSDEDCAESCDAAARACTGADPDGSSCAGGARSCGAGVCLGALGNDCTDGAECESTFCTDDVCCTLADCAPYRCGPAGDCRSTCTMSAECASGYHCDGAGRCIADGAPGGGANEEEGGCSCRLGSRQGGKGGALLGLGFFAVFAIRRRQRA